jgi:hypothetical protein
MSRHGWYGPDLLEGELTSREAAELLGVAEQTMRAWRVRGWGPEFRRSGTRIRYKAESVSEYRPQIGKRSRRVEKEDPEIAALRARLMRRRERMGLDD